MIMIRTMLRTIRSYARFSWRMIKLFCKLLRGIWKVSKLKHPPVTIFGGSRLQADSIYIRKASQLSRLLASDGIPVLNGGGPGIMEASTCGALEVKQGVITAIGITVSGLEFGDPPPKCVAEIIRLDDYAARKWLLINYSIGFVVFPGGFGTINELTEVLTLIQTKLSTKVPIVLIGKEYWQPFIAWLKQSALAQGLITQSDMDLIIVTDEIEEALFILTTYCSQEGISPF